MIRVSSLLAHTKRRPTSPKRSRTFLVNRATVFPHLKLRDIGPDLRTVLAQLQQRVKKSPNFFGAGGSSLVLDFDGFSAPFSSQELRDFVDELRPLKLQPVAYSNAVSPAAASAAVSCGLAHLRGASATSPKPAQATSAAEASRLATSTGPGGADSPAAAPPPPPPTSAQRESASATLERQTVVIDRSLRSGQQVYAKGASLVVLGSVNSGSEVVADGDIFVFGPLIGRVLAGASGNSAARIITTSFRAELASISSVYRTGDLFPQALVGKPAVIWLENDHLQYCNFDVVSERKR